jgi:hypothetical protein
MSDHRLPIHDLVETRLKELGIRRSEVVRRCGFKNVDKGLRRLEAVCGGDLDYVSARMVLNALPTALEVEEGVVDVAVRQSAALIDQSKRMAAAEREAAWRASFKPHALLVGTETRPSSITMFGFSGGPERWLRIPLDRSQPTLTYAAQALEVVRKTPVVMFFGPTTGFIVSGRLEQRRRVRIAMGAALLDRTLHPADGAGLQSGQAEASQGQSICGGQPNKGAKVRTGGPISGGAEPILGRRHPNTPNCRRPPPANRGWTAGQGSSTRYVSLRG